MDRNEDYSSFKFRKGVQGGIGRDGNGLPQQLNVKNGYNTVASPDWETSSIMSGFSDSSQQYCGRFEGNMKSLRAKSEEAFTPRYALMSGKCLSFEGYFKQKIYENDYLIHKINLIYYLEDDSLTIYEPPVANAGHPQGRLVRRGIIPKPNSEKPYTWKDLNVAMDLKIYGITYRICRCDPFTKEYLTSQGIELNEMEEIPDIGKGFFPRFTSGKNDNPKIETGLNDKLYKFLHFDGMVLRFFASWKKNGADDYHYKIHYYLTDDTVEVTECRDKCKSSATQKFIHRMKMPKNEHQMARSSFALSPVTSNVDYFGPADFKVGETVCILGRKFFLYDCDDFTRKYYSETLSMEQGPAIEVDGKQAVASPKEIPPHTGIGSPDDTLQSCLSIQPKAPKKDVKNYIENFNKTTQFGAKMVDEEDRKFMVRFCTGTGKISVFECKVPNSGFRSGCFLKPTLVPKPGTDRNNPEYYRHDDLVPGAVLNAFGWKFQITE